MEYAKMIEMVIGFRMLHKKKVRFTTFVAAQALCHHNEVTIDLVFTGVSLLIRG